jgi:hypothetical protein
MNERKIIQRNNVQILDENGVVKEENKTTIFSIGREPDYVKIYLNDILRLNDIPKSSNAILLAILRRMTYDNDIALFAPVKRQIAKELDIKEVTISKAIELFVEKSILFRKDRGLYLINPYFLGKGRWEEISSVRLQVIYSKEGRMILKTEFENEKVQSNSESRLGEVCEV